MKSRYTPLRHFIVLSSGDPLVWWDDSIRHHWMAELRMQHCFESTIDNYMYYVLLL